MAWSNYRARVADGNVAQYFATWSVRKKMLLSLIPPILLILVVTGYVTNRFSSRYLTQALQRTAQTQNLAQVRELEQMLEHYRINLLELAKDMPDRKRMEAAVAQWAVHRPGVTKELAFVGVNTADTVLLVQGHSGLTEVHSDQFNFIRGNPVSMTLRQRGLKPGSVRLSELTEVVYPPSSFPDHLRPQTFTVFRLMTPVLDDKGGLRGLLVVGIDAHALRNILSLYNSPSSPIQAFTRSSETRLSFFFDDQGWIMFQSENVEEPERELSAETARLGMTGDYGVPDFDRAFRPAPRHELFWRMVVAVQANQTGVEDVEVTPDMGGILSNQHFIVYAPVHFVDTPGKPAEIIGGVAYVDRSRLSDAAEFRHLDVMAVVTCVGMLLVGGVIFFISRGITRPLLMLTQEIRTMFEEKRLRPIRLARHDLESDLLKNALNRMILSIQDKQELIRRQDEHIQKAAKREKVSFDADIPMSHGWRLVGEIPDLIGASAPMAALQNMIRKAAGTDADVLVTGETGTGKELTAEGIHKFSSRANKPFISINCGGLDENLLMDTLFGHVKGAFTEARTDRKGAFLASDGGTLFLDEIGTASDRVQKALLRALSVRRIRPLGSDQDMEFNTRVVAATNVDLMELVQRGEFRDDLYYRLKVLSIQTPPLRHRRDDIPILANHFLKELIGQGRGEVGLSRGALDRLMEHDWPGNVRELKNCITRALAFADGDVIYAEDLLFDEGGLSLEPTEKLAAAQPDASADSRRVLRGGVAQDAGPDGFIEHEREDALTGGFAASAPAQRRETEPMNDEPDEGGAGQRRQVALRLARERGAFSRLDYQKAIGEGVSQRTAQYDLQYLVKKGFLRKEGKGPSTQYLLG
jgi:DNA-binding NtrC family response regulator